MDKKWFRYSGTWGKGHTTEWGDLPSINPKISGIPFPTAYNAVNSREWVESRNK